MKANEINDRIAKEVTERITAMMDAGVNPWRRPWTGVATGAISHTTGKPYSLLNQMLLMYRAGEYLTFNQVKKAGGSVKKGAHGQKIVFWSTQTRTEKEITNEDGETEKVNVVKEYNAPILKAYTVFHIDDCEGIKPKHTNAGPYKVNICTDAETVAADYLDREGIKLNIMESNRAFYSPATDSITVPMREQFPDTAEFYGTLFHEMTHSTGHPKRLNRFEIGTTHFGDADYSREELVAEMCSAFALATVGIATAKTERNSAAYLKSWANNLKNDPKAIIWAASRAEKAMNRIFAQV